MQRQNMHGSDPGIEAEPDGERGAAGVEPLIVDPGRPVGPDVASSLIELLRQLGEASSELVRSGGLHPGGVFDDKLGSIGRLTEASRIAVFDVDERHLRAECVHEWAAAGVEYFRTGSSLIEVSDLPWDIADLESRDHHLDEDVAADFFSMTAVLAVPVVANGRLAMVLTLQWRRHVAPLNAALLPALQLFAHQLHLLASQNRLRERASIDDVTGLANKKLMLMTLNRMLSRLKRSKVTGLAVLLCELEGVRELTESAGRVDGDRALATVARVLESSTRDGDLVGRFSDVVFVVLCEDVPTPGEAVRIGERLRATMLGGLHDAEEFRQARRPFEVSVGVSHATRDGNSGVLLRQADTALYRSRRSASLRVQLAVE